MKDDLEGIIRQLERAQALLYAQRYEEANTAIYEAQNNVQFLKDHG